MHPLDGLAGMATFGAGNTAYNLKFIPEDKLDWKPAPTAKSALEIVNHVVGAVASMQSVVEGGAWAPVNLTPATNLEEAQGLLTSTVARYTAALVQIPPQNLGNSITVWGHYTTTLGRAVGMPVVDLLHHHGQIAYIQTLLGDEEMHFAEAGS